MKLRDRVNPASIVTWSRLRVRLAMPDKAGEEMAHE
jgi:hypothetical protein